MVYAAIMGYGTIGSGVYQVLSKNRKKIAAAAGQEIEVKYVLDLRDFPGDPAEDKIIRDVSRIVNDPEVKLVVETMGGLDPAYRFVKACLEAGKHVATSNKALVAAYGTELLAVAKENRVNFQFEASVGGGIPIIRTLYRAMAGDEVQEITGILNGTTNYILTRMSRDGWSFQEALQSAQALGYAERDPEADVEGYDTCRKIAILTALVTGREVDYREVPTEGIAEICPEDLRYAEAFGLSVKLVGFSRIREGDAVVWVAPMMIGKENPLYAVNDAYNAILVKGSMLGVSMYYGNGAGKFPTASAVVADMIEEAQNLDCHVPIGWNAEKLAVRPADHFVSRYYLRISGKYEELRCAIEQSLGACRVAGAEGPDEFAVLTEPMEKSAFEQAKARLSAGLSRPGEKVLRIMHAEA